MAKVPDYYFDQFAVVPVRECADRIEILLITSRKRKRWVIPKGVKEPGLSGKDSAAKEALEEAGIEGVDYPSSVGTYQYGKLGGVCTVETYVMRVSTLHGRGCVKSRSDFSALGHRPTSPINCAQVRPHSTTFRLTDLRSGCDLPPLPSDSTFHTASTLKRHSRYAR